MDVIAPLPDGRLRLLRRIDVNRESVPQGMVNVGAGVFRGMPVATSLSASSLDDAAGAKDAGASLAALIGPDHLHCQAEREDSAHARTT